MLAYTNATVTILRSVEVSGESSYSQTVASGVKVYINSTQEELQAGYFGQQAYESFRMMTDGVADIKIHDKITDQNGKSYKVHGAQVFNDLTGKHGEYLIRSIFD